MAARPAAGGGRWVSVAPQRLARWIDGFAVRHGVLKVTVISAETTIGNTISTTGMGSVADVVRLEAADGSVAECHVPFPPLPPAGADEPSSAPIVSALVEHACRERTVGVLLVRLGGYAAGVFTGERLVASKVGSRPVHGRSAAGGWSQQRFARRRDKQSAEALRAAADVAFRVLVSRVDELEAVVLGGDRRAVAELRGDRRLAPIFALETGPFLTVPDPRRRVLEEVPGLFRSVRIRLVEPGEQ